MIMATIVAVYDILVFLGFVALSIHFNKWWIIFFSALFMAKYKETKGGESNE